MEPLDDDSHFLSLIEAAEAKAKRRKLDALTSRHNEEGSYMAALKGSKTLPSHQDCRSSDPAKGTVTKFSGNDTFESSGACFKCGKSGHWAKECSGGGGANSVGGMSNQNSEVPEKSCPCGLGICQVFTANTEKNRGRKFYRCPSREENGGCGFFEWCDSLSGNTLSKSASNYPSNPSVPDLQCPCGAGPCLVLTSKTEKSMGQQFYRCPAKQGGGSCGFFKWVSEAGEPRASFTRNDVAGAGGNVSSCFKCGQEGHWARDCPKSSYESNAEVGGSGRSTSSNTCYKCGKAGHWARDCPSQDSRVPTGGRYTSMSSRGSRTS